MNGIKDTGLLFVLYNTHTEPISKRNGMDFDRFTRDGSELLSIDLLVRTFFDVNRARGDSNRTMDPIANYDRRFHIPADIYHDVGCIAHRYLKLMDTKSIFSHIDEIAIMAVFHELNRGHEDPRIPQNSHLERGYRQYMACCTKFSNAYSVPGDMLDKYAIEQFIQSVEDRIDGMCSLS